MCYLELHLDNLPGVADEVLPLWQLSHVEVELPWVGFNNAFTTVKKLFMLPFKRYLWNEWFLLKRILMVSSRSSRSHSMERRLFRSSFVVQSNSSLEVPPACSRSSLHLWWRLCAAFTAFCTSLLHKWHEINVGTLKCKKNPTCVGLRWSGCHTARRPKAWAHTDHITTYDRSSRRILSSSTNMLMWNINLTIVWLWVEASLGIVSDARANEASILYHTSKGVMEALISHFKLIKLSLISLWQYALWLHPLHISRKLSVGYQHTNR